MDLATKLRFDRVDKQLAAIEKILINIADAIIAGNVDDGSEYKPTRLNVDEAYDEKTK